MTTVTAVRRALEEAADKPSDLYRLGDVTTLRALQRVAASPTAVTILANRLSDRGTAGNDAVKANLATLHNMIDSRLSGAEGAAIEWAIDQLTPPELV